VLAGCSSTSPVAVAPRTVPDGSITITVIGPADWPNPIYPDPPEIVIEDATSLETRRAMTDGGTEVRLPAAGSYRVGAVTGDGGCFDTAGVTDAGNPPVEVDDGDTVQLIDTGEICD